MNVQAIEYSGSDCNHRTFGRIDISQIEGGMMKPEDENKLLKEKFRMLIYHLKTLDEAKKRKIFLAIIGGREFKNAIRTLQTVCDEACQEESLKSTLSSVTTSLESGIKAKDHTDLHKFIRSSEFGKLVRTIEQTYKKIYRKSEDYKKDYKQFSEEINNLAEAGIPMWLKLVALAGGVYGTYRIVKKVKKETAEK